LLLLNAKVEISSALARLRKSLSFVAIKAFCFFAIFNIFVSTSPPSSVLKIWIFCFKIFSFAFNASLTPFLSSFSSSSMLSFNTIISFLPGKPVLICPIMSILSLTGRKRMLVSSIIFRLFHPNRLISTCFLPLLKSPPFHL